jgi:hypothetical protein
MDSSCMQAAGEVVNCIRYGNTGGGGGAGPFDGAVAAVGRSVGHRVKMPQRRLSARSIWHRREAKKIHFI